MRNKKKALEDLTHDSSKTRLHKYQVFDSNKKPTAATTSALSHRPQNKSITLHLALHIRLEYKVKAFFFKLRITITP